MPYISYIKDEWLNWQLTKNYWIYALSARFDFQIENSYQPFGSLNGFMMNTVSSNEHRVELYRFKAEKSTRENDFDSFLNLLYWGLVKKWDRFSKNMKDFRKMRFEFLGERKLLKMLSFSNRNSWNRRGRT